MLERIGEPESRLATAARRSDGAERDRAGGPVRDHREGFESDRRGTRARATASRASDLFGIGHRVVHGGEEFKEPTLIDDEVIAAIRRQIPLAPLHNPANLLGIEVTRARQPDVPQVAVFDTAFHQTMPPARIPLRDAVRAVRDPSDPPLRLPRNLPPVRGQAAART